MILYNVTVSVNQYVHQDWLEWMVSEHIPAVLGTGLFVDYKFLRLLSPQDENSEDTTYAVQYFLKNIDDFLLYTEKFAPELQAQTQQRYGENVFAFRTLMEVLNHRK